MCQCDRPRMVLATPGTDWHVSELFDLNLACLHKYMLHFDNIIPILLLINTILALKNCIGQIPNLSIQPRTDWW